MTFHIDSTEGACGTEMLTGSATNAPLRVDHRYLQGLGVVRVRVDHEYGSCRTVAGTVATRDVVGKRHTILLYPYGMSDACGRLFLYGDRPDGSCRAYVSALRTLRSAIALLVCHLGLHQGFQAGRRMQHIVGAGRHTELAPRAMAGEMSGTQRSCRKDGRSPVWLLLVLDNGQSAVHLLLLCLHGCRDGKGSCSQ